MVIWCWAYGKGRKEGNVLFNYALNTFYLRLYGIRHMVKDDSDSERGNLLLPYSVGCSLPKSMLLGQTAFYKIFNAIGDILVTGCHKVFT